jgi:hypothetical protein
VTVRIAASEHHKVRCCSIKLPRCCCVPLACRSSSCVAPRHLSLLITCRSSSLVAPRHALCAPMCPLFPPPAFLVAHLRPAKAAAPPNKFSALPLRILPLQHLPIQLPTTSSRQHHKLRTKQLRECTVFCLLECHKISALFTMMRTPVWDHGVSWHPAWSESTKQEVTTETPHSSSVSRGMASSASG